MPLRPVRPALLAVALLLVAIASIVHPHSRSARASNAGLAGRFDPYLHRRATDALADPVNLVFLNATPDQVAEAAIRVLGWSETQGDQMTFIDGGVHRPVAYQIASDLGWGARLHMRIEGGDAGNGSYVLAGVHRDDTFGCGHVGHYFEEARQTVAQAFARDGYMVTMLTLDNTAAAPQCNGTMTAGDGVAAVIDLASATLPAQPPTLPAGHLIPVINLSSFVDF